MDGQDRGSSRREPRGVAALVWRALVGGLVGGGALAGTVLMPDVLRGLTDPDFRASYGVWDGLVIAVPIGALLGLVCALPAIAGFAWAYPSGPRLARLSAGLAATTPLIILAFVLRLPLPLTLLAVVLVFTIVFVAAPYITTQRTGVGRLRGQPPGQRSPSTPGMAAPGTSAGA